MRLWSILFAALGTMMIVGGGAAQDIYNQPNVRNAVQRIERHGDEFKDAFKKALENVPLSEREKRVRGLAEDLEDEVDDLQKNFKDGHYGQARENLNNSMLMAASVDRFMQRNYFGPEARRAWTNLRFDLNVLARAYNVPPLPAIAVQGYRERAGSADRMQQNFGWGSNQRLQREVRHELVMLPYYGVFDNLEFRVEGDTVTLLGQVTRPSLRSSAEQVVKGIEGVSRVINDIQVLPVSSGDDRIRMEVYRAIYGQTVLNRYALQAVPPIHIIVSNGNVSLDGVVATEADKNLAGIQARSVPGVFAVTNHLRVETGS